MYGMRMQLEIEQIKDPAQGGWSIFISYSSNDKEKVSCLCKKMTDMGILHNWDDKIELAAEYYSAEIFEMIHKCNAAIIYVSENYLKSKWCNFELGLLEGNGKNIYLYDKDDVLKKKTHRYHYDRFLPAFNNEDQLIDAVSNERIFYTLFNHETEQLSESIFRKQADRELAPTKLTLILPGFDALFGMKDNDDKSGRKYRIRVLIVHFGNYTGKKQLNENSKCPIDKEDLTNAPCSFSKFPCALTTAPNTENNPECVLLNHVWDSVTITGDRIEILLPVHRKYGTTFKIMVDADDGETADAFIRFFKEYKLSPSFSMSGTQHRVYLSLIPKRSAGIFRVNDRFNNNFVCPGALR